jgi:hypothetical protein
MASSASFEFAGRAVRVDGAGEVVDMIAEVLAHHAAPAAAASAVLTCTVATEPADASALSGPLGRRHWIVPADILGNGFNWFFYHGFAAVLARLWADLGLVGLHGGLLVDGENKGVLVVGDRHDGKSSVAAGWLDEGGRLASDDTALLDVHLDPPMASGFLRELHLDKALVPMLPGLTGLGEAEPYLPGRPRLGYDWIERFPGQMVAYPVVVAAVIRTRVDSTRPSAGRRLPVGSAWRLSVKAAGGADAGACLSPARAFLESLDAWEVTWGPDVWTTPGKHFAVLRSLLESTS